MFGENMITAKWVNASNYTTASEVYYAEFRNAERWALDNFLNQAGVFSDITVVDCKTMASEFGCTVSLPDGNIRPCILHYQGKPLVWISTTTVDAPEVSTMSGFGDNIRNMVSDEVMNYAGKRAINAELIQLNVTPYKTTEPSMRYPNIVSFDMRTSSTTAIVQGENVAPCSKLCNCNGGII
jgi:hypothetical protein